MDSLVILAIILGCLGATAGFSGVLIMGCDVARQDDETPRKNTTQRRLGAAMAVLSVALLVSSGVLFIRRI